MTEKTFRLLTPRVSWRPEEAGLLLHDRRADALFEGNRTAREILPLLERGATETEVVRHLAEVFEADDARLRRDVRAFLSHLSAEGLIRATP